MIRSPDKKFWQQRSDPEAPEGWWNGLEGLEPPLYRLPELCEADPGWSVFVLEGERDVDRARDEGLVATCNAMGAGSFRQAHAKTLRSRKVVIIPDNDSDGRTHAQRVAAMVYPAGTSVKIVELPEVADIPGGDLTDFFERGGKRKRLRQLVAETDEWAPEPVVRRSASPWPVLAIANVMAKPVDWLVPNRIPRGKLTVVAGRQGYGKTTAMLAIATTLSHGGSFLDGRSAPVASTLYVTGEDDPADTLRPKLDAMGADVTKISVLTLIDTLMAGGDIDLASPEGVDSLRQVIIDGVFDLVVIDPINSFLGDMAKDTGNDRAMRRVLVPLAAVAAETGAAIVYLLHLNKDSTKTDPLDRIMDSTAHTALARSVLAVTRDPEDHARRMLDVVKTNLAEIPLSWLFRIEFGGLEWIGESNDHYQDWQARDNADLGQRDEVVEAILETLADGRHPWGEVAPTVRRNTGASDRTARRYRDRMKQEGRIDKDIIPRSDGKPGGGTTVWFRTDLPGQSHRPLVSGQVNIVKANSSLVK